MAVAAVCAIPQPPLLPTAPPIIMPTDINNNNPSSSSPSSSSSESTYTALISQYLNLLKYDNATFLAERYAASFPRSVNAIYMLAYCYYREGRVKSARSVLVNRFLDVREGGSDDGGGVGGDGIDSSIRNSVRYLHAKCCVDLGLYSEAEESLLRRCREMFADAVRKSDDDDHDNNNNGSETVEGGDGGGAEGEGTAGTLNGVKITGGNLTQAMDAWIIQTSTIAPPAASTTTQTATQTNAAPKQCPIPNGAAGISLLGDICRNTNRRKRALEYYRLSLTLDPLLWTSYQAICELAGPSSVGGRWAGKSGKRMGNKMKGVELDEDGETGEEWRGEDAADDPERIFGVTAPMLSPRHEQEEQMTTTMVTGGGNSFRLNKLSQHTPSTPYSAIGRMQIDTGGRTTDIQQQQQQQPRPSFGASDTVGVTFDLPSATGARRIRDGVRGGEEERGRLPQTNLFASTPATALATPNTDRNDNDKSEAIGYADKVLDRARRVVAGLAYEPSPESMRRRSGSVGVGGGGGGELTFSSTPMPTAADTTAPFQTGLSTVKGEKRSLFSTNEEDEGGEVTAGTSRKKSPRKEGTVGTAAGDGNLQQLGEFRTAEERGGGHVERVLEMLCGLGAAYKCLCQYRSQDALELFRELPPEQINTGWVQHQIGKAYFEMSDYQHALRALQTMQKVEPHRIKGLDILSTTLWQLKKEVELSDLAQRAVDFDRMAPESWFVVGNCFSLQKEHDTAISFFRRAIQLNPSYTYAHTLCGHEYTSNEDFEKAISCYRDAIRVDSRHYNAWYGLGAIYFRQEKFDLAEYHFRRALDINSQSSVLHCHLGMAQHQNGKTMEALETLAGAFRLDPRNPQAHYQRATIFMTLDRPEDALSELERVRSAAPREASVHFNMGKVHKRLGEPAKAMRCFLTALDLDPKDNNLIKAAMDRLDEPDVEEEVSVF